MMLDHGYKRWYIFFSNITELNTENPIDVQPSVVYGNSWEVPLSLLSDVDPGLQ